MSTAFTVASASDAVHVWDVQGPPPSERPSVSAAPSVLHAPPHASRTLRPHAPTSSVLTIQWNHNNGVLGSGGSDGTLALSNVSDGKLMMRLPGDAPHSGSSSGDAGVAPVSAMAFSSGSRYLCAAGGVSDPGSGGAAASACVVTIWDLKKHVKSRRLTGHTAPITALDFGAGDQHVASAAMSGEVLVHNLSLSTLAAKLVSPALAHGGGVALRDCQHSPHRKQLLGACGDAGVVEMWDCNTSSLSGTLRPPNAANSASSSLPSPLSALRFSPTSPSLLCSVGLGKSLVFFDIASGKSIRDVGTDYALTALDFHGDGCTLVLGTMQGHLLLYDIRNASRPTAKILNAHPGKPVHAVKFTHTQTAQAQTSSAAAHTGRAVASSSAASSASASSSSSGNVYDSKSSTFIDNTAKAAATSSIANGRHNNVSMPLPSTHTSNSTTATHASAPTPAPAPAPTPVLSAPSGVGDIFSPIRGTAPPSNYGADSPYGSGQQHSSRAAAAASGAGGVPLGLSSFMSPIASNGSHHHDMGETPTSVSHLQQAAVGGGARPAHLIGASPSSSNSPPRPRGGGSGGGRTSQHGADADGSASASAAAASAGAFASMYHAAPAASPASSSFSSSSQSQALTLAPSSTSSRAAALAQLQASPPRQHLETANYPMAGASFASPAAAASSARDHGMGGFGAAAAAAAAPSPSSSPSSSSSSPATAPLSEYHVTALRSLLDSSLYSLRSELRSQVTDLHVEMLKQFHSQQVEQERAMDAFTQRFEEMVREVRALREDYQQLKHIY